MLVFKYQAKDVKGNDREGEIEAINEKDAIDKLHGQDLIIISLKVTKRQALEKETIGKSTERIGEKNTKKCPYCAEAIQYDAIKCKHCGEMLEKKEVTGQKKNTTPRGYLIIIIAWIIIVGVVYVSNLFSPKYSTTSTSTYTKYPELGESVKLKGSYPFGATKELHEKLSNIIIAQDKEALIQLMATGLVGLTKEGEEAYYEGQEGEGWLPSGIVKVRFKGSTATYYTNREAVGIR